jgi:hypothetical protein
MIAVHPHHLVKLKVPVLAVLLVGSSPDPGNANDQPIDDRFALPPRVCDAATDSAEGPELAANAMLVTAIASSCRRGNRATALVTLFRPARLCR